MRRLQYVLEMDAEQANILTAALEFYAGKPLAKCIVREVSGE